MWDLNEERISRARFGTCGRIRGWGGLVGLGAAVVAPPVAAQPFADGQTASVVLGKLGFFGQQANDLGPHPAGLNSPYDVAIDGRSGVVFVVDSGNNRVVRYPSLAQYVQGGPATGVLGQPHLFVGFSGASPTAMSSPTAAVVSSDGALYVSDTGNHRVLRFDAAAIRPDGAAADAVLGQTDAVSRQPGLSAARMYDPRGLALDTAGRLYVADSRNHRVLWFDAAATRLTGAPADGVLGARSFATRSTTLSDTTFSFPADVVLDPTGALYVSLEAANSVLRFSPQMRTTLGGRADAVLGQSQFGAFGRGDALHQMWGPSGMAADAEGRLYVADSENRRVLRFDRAATATTGHAADGVIGTAPPILGPIAWSGVLHFPQGLEIGPGGGLCAAESGGHRVLCFERPETAGPATAASAVLGQASFGEAGPNASGYGARTFANPAGIAIDAQRGKVYVADETNHRVLRFGSLDALATGQAAEAVFGQPADALTEHGVFSYGFPTTSAPRGVAIDADDHLFVADRQNARVLRYDGASAKASGALPDGVLGRASLREVETGQPASRTTLLRPGAVAVDRHGRLYVADDYTHRVLRFDAAASKPNGAPADGVLGQPDFTSSSQGLARGRLLQPSALAVDRDGRLYVADEGNGRVLRFDNASTKSNGAPADGVLGQSGFDTRDPTYAPGVEVRMPRGLAVDDVGRLYISDGLFHRVLRFDAAASKPNGAPADGVLGQTDLTGNRPGTGPATLRQPHGLALDGRGARLFVADAGNHRLVAYEATSPLSAATSRIAPRQIDLRRVGNGIRMDLPEPMNVQVTLWDVLGRRVAVLFSGAVDVERTVALPSQFARGVYVVVAQAGGMAQTLRVVLN